MTIRRTLPVLLLLILCCSCKDQEYYTPIPSVRFTFTVDPEMEDRQELFVSLGFAEFTKAQYPYGREGTDTGCGFGGVIVFNTGIEGEGKFRAYDLACPVEVDASVLVEGTHDGVAICPECGTRYNLFNGTSQAGTNPLRIYRISGPDMVGRYKISN